MKLLFVLNLIFKEFKYLGDKGQRLIKQRYDLLNPSLTKYIMTVSRTILNHFKTTIYASFQVALRITQTVLDKTKIRNKNRVSKLAIWIVKIYSK